MHSPRLVSLCALALALALPVALHSAEATATDADKAAQARLVQLGSRGVRAHDPSTIVQCGDEYWTFYTGRGVPSWRSKDMKTWTAGPPVFKEAPAWVATAVPENRNAMFWAPDVMRVGDRYLLYYSVSSFGKNTSAIALATNKTLDPASPDFRWKDEGIVVRCAPPDKFNTIDPAIFREADGRLWMVFGSYWSGIKLIELDPATGQRLAPALSGSNGPDSPMHALAHKQQIEAAFIWRHGAHYYLFVNWGHCCRGLESTYNIRVGRADQITGPYLDRDGKNLLDGGGTPVLATDGAFIGPGHAGIHVAEGREWFSCHFYNGTTPRGTPMLALRPLAWDRDGWPVVGALE
ncbi:MAG: arabinan endo-1,5-alpha-L-arabinosidase [Verrucomicrobia bacterium]|nr:arabinan endo-1,5-alpha-L-arabinosidase [Verrucomicrobiota bacterium]